MPEKFSTFRVSSLSISPACFDNSTACLPCLSLSASSASISYILSSMVPRYSLSNAVCVFKDCKVFIISSICSLSFPNRLMSLISTVSSEPKFITEHCSAYPTKLPYIKLLGLGVARRASRASRADLILSTGDHAVNRSRLLFYFPERRIRFAAALISVFLSTFFLIGAIVCLLLVANYSMGLRVGMIVLFTGMFAGAC